MQFEADQAKKQMEFQDRMSSTAYQRAAEDLKKAGLNPLMALTNNASTPGGAAGGGSSATALAPEFGSPAQAAATSSVESAKALASLMSSVTQARLFSAQEANLKADTAEKGVRAQAISKDIPKADLFNRMYNWADRAFQRLQQNSAKSPEQLKRERNQKNVDAFNQMIKNQKPVKIGRPR